MIKAKYFPKCQSEVTTIDNQVYDCSVCNTQLFYSELDRYKGETKQVAITVTDPRAAVRLIRSMVTEKNMQSFTVKDCDMQKFTASVRAELARIGQSGKYQIRDLKLPSRDGFIVKLTPPISEDTKAYRSYYSGRGF